MRPEERQLVLLRLLVATTTQLIESFEAAESPGDEDFVRDLKRTLGHSRWKLATFASQNARPS